MGLNTLNSENSVSWKLKVKFANPRFGQESLQILTLHPHDSFFYNSTSKYGVYVKEEKLNQAIEFSPVPVFSTYDAGDSAYPATVNWAVARSFLFVVEVVGTSWTVLILAAIVGAVVGFA
ncbi:hypothetical protein L1887_06448 [Cichorium endivia]|nr:hypothetical protein L1887_06448 [Cichorium endivia]